MADDDVPPGFTAKLGTGGSAAAEADKAADNLASQLAVTAKVSQSVTIDKIIQTAACSEVLTSSSDCYSCRL